MPELRRRALPAGGEAEGGAAAVPPVTPVNPQSPRIPGPPPAAVAIATEAKHPPSICQCRSL